MEICDARIEHIPSLVELEATVFTPADGLISARAFGYHIKHRKNVLLVAQQTNKVLVGYILIKINGVSARIYSIAVHPDCQGQGVGRKLVTETLQRVAKTNISTVRLEVRSKNLSAIMLYQSLGFVKSGLKKNYYPGEDDAWVMKYELAR